MAKSRVCTNRKLRKSLRRGNKKSLRRGNKKSLRRGNKKSLRGGNKKSLRKSRLNKRSKKGGSNTDCTNSSADCNTKLGDGNFGEVNLYCSDETKCTTDKTGCYAVKTLTSGNADDFEHEAELHELVSVLGGDPKHPYVAEFHSYCKDPSPPKITMVYYPLGSLDKFDISQFNEASLKDFLSNIVEGMIHIHGQGVYHLDLAERNILIEQKDAGTFVPRITDFGLSLKKNEEKGVAGKLPIFQYPYEYMEDVINKEYRNKPDKDISYVDVFGFGIIFVNLVLSFIKKYKKVISRHKLHLGNKLFTNIDLIYMSESVDTLKNQILKLSPIIPTAEEDYAAPPRPTPTRTISTAEEDYQTPMTPDEEEDYKMPMTPDEEDYKTPMIPDKGPPPSPPPRSVKQQPDGIIILLLSEEDTPIKKCFYRGDDRSTFTGIKEYLETVELSESLFDMDFFNKVFRTSTI